MPPKTAEKLLDREWVYDAYVVRGLTMDEVAVEASASRSAVMRAMRKYDIVSRKPKSKYGILNDKEWLVDAYVNQKMSTEKIAKIAGCDSGLVHGMLVSLGVTTRSLHEAQQLRVSSGLCSGENSPSWKGGRTKSVHGYMYVRKPQHPNAGPNGYVAEHRLVAEETLGRHLTSDEVVHHVNGDKMDNSPENLVVTVRSEHRLTHKNINARLYVLEARVKELEAIVSEYERRYGNLG